MYKWYHDATLIVTWDSGWPEGMAHDPDTTWTDHKWEKVPLFYLNNTHIQCTTSQPYTNSNSVWWRVDGSSNDGHLANVNSTNTHLVCSNTSGDTVITEWYQNVSDSEVFAIYIDGWRLPGGM